MFLGKKIKYFKKKYYMDKHMFILYTCIDYIGIQKGHIIATPVYTLHTHVYTLQMTKWKKS